MNKKPNTQLLHSVWNNKQQFITKRNVDLEKFKLDELIAKVFSNGPFYYYVVDFFDMQIKYMNPGIKNIHGVDLGGTSFLDKLDLIHPDDMDFVSKAQALIWDLLYNKIGVGKNHLYKMSYCFRFKVANGSYELFNHQSIILNADDEGGMAKSLNIHTNISHLTSENNYKVSAIGMFGEPSYLNLNVYERKEPEIIKSPFTNREKEIIRLLTDGLNSRDVASQLNISLETVKNHRKNILKKSGCTNLGQLIAKCIKEGLI